MSIRPSARRLAMIGSALALTAGLVATPLMSAAQADPSGPAEYRKSSFTIFEVSTSLSITDNTPVRVSSVPPAPIVGRPGVGDDLIIESSLFGDARFFDSTQPPPPVPGLPPVTGPYRTFEPVGEAIGDLLGACTFVRYVDQRPVSEDRLASCQLTLRLPQGDLVASGLLDVSGLEGAQPVDLAIVGGTGVYSRAAGSLTLTQPSVPAFDRFTLEVNWRR